ncbi:MAG: type II toxin-antitoxin system RelE/ParE family toxin [Gammaproteobacteria bacterium]
MKYLRLYRTRNGKEPFVEWASSLKDHVAVAQVNNRVRRLTLGQRGDCKRVGKGVFELRIHYSPGYRVYFAEHGKEIVILLLGGHKGSQKRDIKQAVDYWHDYKERYNE